MPGTAGPGPDGQDRRLVPGTGGEMGGGGEEGTAAAGGGGPESKCGMAAAAEGGGVENPAAAAAELAREAPMGRLVDGPSSPSARRERYLFGGAVRTGCSRGAAPAAALSPALRGPAGVGVLTAHPHGTGPLFPPPYPRSRAQPVRSI